MDFLMNTKVTSIKLWLTFYLVDWPRNIFSVLQCALLAGHLGLQDHFTIDEVGAVNKNHKNFFISLVSLLQKRKEKICYHMVFILILLVSFN